MRMDKEEFVSRIRQVVYDGSVKATLEMLREPPGRRPSAKWVHLSEWFKALGPEDQQAVRDIVQQSTRGAVFDFLTVPDGLMSIRDLGEEFTLELWCHSDEGSVLLNDGEEGEFLHDLFASEVPPE